LVRKNSDSSDKWSIKNVISEISEARIPKALALLAGQAPPKKAYMDVFIAFSEITFLILHALRVSMPPSLQQNYT